MSKAIVVNLTSLKRICSEVYYFHNGCQSKFFDHEYLTKCFDKGILESDGGVIQVLVCY